MVMLATPLIKQVVLYNFTWWGFYKFNPVQSIWIWKRLFLYQMWQKTSSGTEWYYRTSPLVSAVVSVAPVDLSWCVLCWFPVLAARLCSSESLMEKLSGQISGQNDFSSHLLMDLISQWCCLISWIELFCVQLEGMMSLTLKKHAVFGFSYMLLSQTSWPPMVLLGLLKCRRWRTAWTSVCCSCRRMLKVTKQWLKVTKWWLKVTMKVTTMTGLWPSNKRAWYNGETGRKVCKIKYRRKILFSFPSTQTPLQQCKF